MKVDLSHVPDAPGAYLMFDRQDRILYVGRAGCLRERVRSYWHASLRRPGLRAMVRRIRRVVTVTTASEHEAAFLERALLERHDPPFNRTLGLESIVAIRLAPTSVTAVHEIVPAEGVRYFGPYLGWSATAGAASALARTFPIHLCRPAREMTSVERDMARRRGVSVADGPALARSITAVLERDATAVEDVIVRTEGVRDQASALALYERAAELQGEIAGVRWVAQPQSIASFDASGAWRIEESVLPEVYASSR